MKTIALYGKLQDDAFNLDITSVTHDTGSADDDSWNSVVSILAKYKQEKEISDLQVSDSFTYPSTINL